MPKGLVWLIAAIITVAKLGVLPAFIGEKDEERSPAPLAQGTRRPRPQPGPAPPGKVWSADHGHWHDAPQRVAIPGMPGGGSTTSPIQIQTTTDGSPSTRAPIRPPVPTPQPQPPGPVPAGKVWSVEHGHWHNARP